MELVYFYFLLGGAATGYVWGRGWVQTTWRFFNPLPEKQ